ncbi:hypothetical protein EC968_001865 [Mortierella alpina]|nr:hypothetical protein EC968_001865 [Mortierella alpina]
MSNVPIGNFTETSKNIRITGGHLLQATCQTKDGGYKDSTLDLNDFIGNEDGNFQWDGVNFSQTAEDVQIQVATDSTLSAELKARDQHLVPSKLNLDERITNNNGVLQYQ